LRSDFEEAEFDADGVGEVRQVVGVAGDHCGLVLNCSGNDDRVDHIGSPRGAAGDASGATGALVIGEDVAALDLMNS